VAGGDALWVHNASCWDAKDLPDFDSLQPAIIDQATGRPVYRVEIDGQERLVYEGHDGRFYDYNEHSMTYPGLTKERDADYRQQIDNAERNGNSEIADNIRYERYKESKDNSNQTAKERDDWQVDRDRVKKNQRRGKEQEDAGRSGISEELGIDFDNNNTNSTCTFSCNDTGTTNPDNVDNTKTRPDSIGKDAQGNTVIHEHKDVSGDPPVVYNTDQMKAQRDATDSDGNPVRHVVTISSKAGLDGNDTPIARPSKPMSEPNTRGNVSQIYYSNNGQVTHKWNPATNSWRRL